MKTRFNILGNSHTSSVRNKSISLRLDRTKVAEKDNTLKKKGNIMKKIVLTVVTLLSLSMTATATENRSEYLAMDVNMNSLARTLSLTVDQKREVEDIHNNFCSEMRKAEVADDAERMTLAREALKKDIKKLSGVLDRDQMRMYLRLLNITFVNRGVNFSE